MRQARSTRTWACGAPTSTRSSRQLATTSQGSEFAGAVLLVIVALATSAGVRRALAGGFGDLHGLAVPVTTLDRVCLDLAIVSATLTYYGIFLLTPSYNWMTLIGVLLAAAGLLPLLGVEQRRRHELTAAILLALGCFLALMGRPTSGVGLALLAAVLVLLASPRPFFRRVVPLLISAVVLIICGLVHLVFFVGWADSLAITRRTQYFATHDVGGHSFGQLIQQSVHQLGLVPHGVFRMVGPAPLLGLLPLVALVVPVGRRSRLVGTLGAIAVLAVGVTIALRNGFGGGPRVYLTLPYAGIALLITSTLVLISSVITSLASANYVPRRAIALRAARAVAAGGFLAAGAILYAFSSSNGLVNQMWGAFGIFAVACIVLLVGSLGPMHVPIVAAVMALVCGMAAWSALTEGANAGYRTAPVAESTVSTQVSSRGATLSLGPEYSQALNTLRTGATAAGFTPGTPLVDLTPFSPGIGYLLGSLPPTTIMLGYSAEVAEWALAQQDQQKWHDAWVLVDSGDARSLPTSVLSTLGRSFPDDYERVASATWPIKPAEHLELWRPKAS